MGDSFYISKFNEYGLVDILSIQPDIKVDIKYSTTENFTGKILYTEDVGVYTEPTLAQAVAQAQKTLKSINKNLSLSIYARRGFFVSL